MITSITNPEQVFTLMKMIRYKKNVENKKTIQYDYLTLGVKLTVVKNGCTKGVQHGSPPILDNNR